MTGHWEFFNKRFHWSVQNNYCHTGPISVENLEIAVSEIKRSSLSTCPNVKMIGSRPQLFWPLFSHLFFFSLVEQDQDGQRQKDDKTAEDYTQLSCKSDLTSQSNLLKTFMIHRLSHSAKLKYSRDSTNDF